MSETISGEGALLSIGTTGAGTNQTEFEADTYDVVGQIGEIGEFGVQRGEAAFTALNDGLTRRARGSKDVGLLALTVAHKPGGEAGQNALKAAFEAAQGADEFNFRVTLNDQITPSTGNPTTLYFRAKVMSRRIQNIGTDNTVTWQIQLAINTIPIEVAAA
jgi:hypothetical protein